LQPFSATPNKRASKSQTIAKYAIINSSAIVTNHQKLDIDGVNITVTSGDKPAGKGKAKAKSDGVEILTGAKLRLKEGQRYALVGRNGTGKSSKVT
jgi:ABC-type multidrug transport system ATPase subunit